TYVKTSPETCAPGKLVISAYACERDATLARGVPKGTGDGLDARCIVGVDPFRIRHDGCTYAAVQTLGGEASGLGKPSRCPRSRPVLQVHPELWRRAVELRAALMASTPNWTDWIPSSLGCAARKISAGM